MDGQRVPALLAALMGEGVSEETIERAMTRVEEFPLGYCLSDMADSDTPHALRETLGEAGRTRTFIFDQADRLNRA